MVIAVGGVEGGEAVDGVGVAGNPGETDAAADQVGPAVQGEDQIGGAERAGVHPLGERDADR